MNLSVASFVHKSILPLGVSQLKQEFKEFLSNRENLEGSSRHDSWGA